MLAKRLTRMTREWLADSLAAPILVPLYKRFSPRAEYDRQTHAVMDRVLTARSCCVDIGAHRGNLLREMVRRAPQGAHHAFEPVPTYAARLRQRFKGVTVHEVALSDRAGVARFVHVTGSPGLSGFKPNARATSDMNPVDIEVRAARLDDELPADYRPDFVKIDVEGAEHLVLLGGRGALSRARPVIVFECWITDERYEGFSPETVFDILAGVGLRVSLMRRWLEGEPAFSRDQFASQLRNRLDAYYIAYP
jgi:FkbM family methyltransferase